MATWNLTLHYSRLFVYKRLFAKVADLRVSSQFASYHPTSPLQRRDGEANPTSPLQRRDGEAKPDHPTSPLQRRDGEAKPDHPTSPLQRRDGEAKPDHPTSPLQRRDGEAKPDVRKRRSVLPGSGVQHSPAGVQHRPAVSGTWQRHHGADDIPEIPASKKVWRADPQGPRESRPWAEGRVSSELQKLSLDDFPKARERAGKDSKEDKNSEIVFGVSPCLLALTQGRRRARRLYVKEGEASKRASVQQVCEEAHRRGVEIQRVSKKQLDKMCSGRVHQGVCLQASPLTFLIKDEPPKPPSAGSAPPLWLVLDAVQDPMNLGAIIRSAYFLGVDRIASSLQNSCPLTPMVSKASSGVMEVMEVYGYESLADMLKVKVSQGWQVVGTVGAEGRGFPAPVLCCSEFHMTRPTLLLMGGEGGGLSPELCLQCEVLLTVPPLRALAPGVESLNVSVATGILLYSLLSSRRGGRVSPPGGDQSQLCGGGDVLA